MFGQKKIAKIVAEFLGAALLAMVLYSIVARTAFPLFTGLAAGTTYGLLIILLGGVSGVHANPAVTLGLWTLRKIQTTEAIVYIVAQMLGGLAAWALLKYFLGRSLTSLAANQFDWKIMVAEAVGTAVFGFGLAAAHLRDFDNSKLAVTAGASLLVGVLVASMASNAILNPAVAVGIQSWNWHYATGPIIGAIVGMNLYGLLFAPDILLKQTKSKRK